MLGAAGLVALALVGVLAWFVYATPAIGVFPPDRIAMGRRKHSGAGRGALPAEQAAMVGRGRYLFTVASCAFCHMNDGSGGFKLSGAYSGGYGFGTIFVPNITPDKEAGIGGWSDSEIARAIRSGVARDGRPLYWQGMPWITSPTLTRRTSAPSSPTCACSRLSPKNPGRRPAVGQRLQGLHVLGAQDPGGGLQGMSPHPAPRR